MPRIARASRALPLALATALIAVASGPATPPQPAPPIAFGDAGSSVTLDSAGEQLLLRFVADRTGVLARINLRAKLDGTACSLGGSVGYAKGSGGMLRASLFPVLPDGRPDLSRRLAREEFPPCARYAGGAVAIAANVAVEAGQELALVVDNADPQPNDNFFSLSFLYTRSGLVGANGRNERNAGAADGAYGLDPRELVGWSADGGANWQLPGGPYGPGYGKAFIPTYVLEYADNGRSGQPYYTASAIDGTYTMVYPSVPVRWTIAEIGASTTAVGAARVVVSVDGVERASVQLSGAGLLRAPIAPITVEAGSTVRLTTTVGAAGLALRRLSADSAWATLMRLGQASRLYLEGDSARALPLYPLPLYPVDSIAPTPPSGLAVQSATETTLALAFQPALDARGVTSYQVSLNNVPRSTLDGSARSFTLTSLPCASSYTLTLTASDAAGNRSSTASLAVTTAGCPSSPIRAPLAGGDAAANVPLATAGARVMLRFVPGRTGTVEQLSLQAKLEGTPCVPSQTIGYAAGSGGLLDAVVYAVRPDGTPDTGSVLASDRFAPCSRYDAPTVALDLAFAVAAGQELALVVSNVDPQPAANFFSLNFLYLRTGVEGANGRNERSTNAADAYYRLDPRELVGWSTNGGATWTLPGGPYGSGGGRVFLPTFVLHYADGGAGGQPYYYSSAIPDGSYTMVFPNVPVRWTITQLGAYASAPGSATVTLAVDGVQTAAATLAGTGILRVAIAPVTVNSGSTVTITSRVGSGGLGLRRLSADAIWTDRFGLGSGFRYFLQGDPSKALPLYPLPMYAADLQAPTAPAGPSLTAGNQTSLAFAWGAAADDRAVLGYRVSLNGTTLTDLDADARSYTASGLSCGRSYTFGVSAADGSFNRSAVAELTASTTDCPQSQAEVRPPLPFGDGSSSIAFDRAAKWLALRFVPARSGTLARLELRARLDRTPCATGVAGYASGTSGQLRATLHAVRADGTPQLGSTLATDLFTPCSRFSSGAVTVNLNAAVTDGREYALVVRNADADPAANFFSLSFLRSHGALAGANGRNERDSSALDADYGLDPRELVGWSTDSGAGWALPGGPAGAVYVPAYVLDYADGARGGQPYYYTTVLTGTATMVYPTLPVQWRISELGASASGAGSATVSLSVDGVLKASAVLTGSGMLRAPIPPVVVSPGSTVRLTTTTGAGGLALRLLHADGRWSGLMGLGTGFRYYRDGDPANAFPVYPLPLYPGLGG